MSDGSDSGILKENLVMPFLVQWNQTSPDPSYPEITLIENKFVGTDFIQYFKKPTRIFV